MCDGLFVEMCSLRRWSFVGLTVRADSVSLNMQFGNVSGSGSKAVTPAQVVQMAPEVGHFRALLPESPQHLGLAYRL